MIIDARSLPENETIETDICIVGAGIAGITLARELKGQGFRVCLLESGGLEPDKATQSLYWGEKTGHPYYELDTARTRCFGGTSHLWLIEVGVNRLGARMHPLDEIDFEERDWIPYSGWPFGKAHLDPYYERAQSICQLGPYTYEVEDWEDPVRTPRLPFTNGQVKTTIFQFGPRDPFFDEYREEISHADNITTYLYANVIEVETVETAQTVTRLRVACLQGNQFWVSAKLFILATGGIEVPRLLLLSNKTQSAGLGNQHDLVGRFFMEHPHLWSGIYFPSDPKIFETTDLYKIRMVNKVPIMGKLALTEKVLRREKLLNYCVSIHASPLPRKYLPKGVSSYKALRAAISRGEIPDDFGQHLGNIITDAGNITIAAYKKAIQDVSRVFGKSKSEKIEAFRLNHMTEQSPNPDSRVTLVAERDALGQNRVQLNWQLSPIDIQTIVRAQEIIHEELHQAGLGRLEIEMKGLTPPSNLTGGWHHMGTTRMHVDPKKGVVDENSQVHGLSNLFIAGPSVFPTSGYANPVLTTVALTVKLADHVKKLMR